MRVFYFHWVTAQSASPDGIPVTPIASLAGNGLMVWLFLLERKRAERAEERGRERDDKFMDQILKMAHSAERITKALGSGSDS